MYIYGNEDQLISDIQQAIEEGRQHNYSDQIIRSDIEKLITEYKRQIINEVYADIEEELKEKLSSIFSDYID